jgi:DNA-binding CsgD family transcriptional regulator/GAF domain-containing protein
MVGDAPSALRSEVVPSGQVLPHPGSDPAGGIEPVRFAQSLCAASSPQELERRFLAGFGRVMGVAIYGYDLIDPKTKRPSCFVAANVSDVFLACYRRTARDVDPVLANAYATGRSTYNMGLMSAEEWLETEVYRRAYRLHGIRHVVEVPVPSAGRIVGNLHFATGASEHGFSPVEIRVAEALARVLGVALEMIEARRKAARERAQALAALELAATPIVISDPEAPSLRLNDAGRRLLGDVIDAEEQLHQLLARPATRGRFSRRVEVELVTGEVGVIHAHAAPPHEDGALVAVLELEREHAGISPGALSALTPREGEVAALVVDGLTDREIAERLSLSRHTISQYVKRVYRKLDVDSRVGLTRLLLGRHAAIRRD